MRVMTRPGRSPPARIARPVVTAIEAAEDTAVFCANVHQVGIGRRDLNRAHGLPSKIRDTGCHISPSFCVRHMRHDPVKTVEVLLGSRVRYTIQTPRISASVSDRVTSCMLSPRKCTRPMNCHVTHICVGSVEIIHHPAAIAAKLFKELIGPRIGGDNGAVVLRTTTILTHIAGGDVDVIKHGGGKAVTVRPGEATVLADVHTAVIHVVHPAWGGGWHEQAVMISVRVIRCTTRGIPSGCFSRSSRHRW